MSFVDFVGSLLDPQNKEVGQKLGLATLLMFTLPIVTYFVALHIFREQKNADNWAGGAAILVTNLIVGGYCYSAYVEDLAENKDKDNDASRPRVGIYKQRTD